MNLCWLVMGGNATSYQDIIWQQQPLPMLVHASWVAGNENMHVGAHHIHSCVLWWALLLRQPHTVDCCSRYLLHRFSGLSTQQSCLFKLSLKFARVHAVKHDYHRHHIFGLRSADMCLLHLMHSHIHLAFALFIKDASAITMTAFNTISPGCCMH